MQEILTHFLNKKEPFFGLMVGSNPKRKQYLARNQKGRHGPKALRPLGLLDLGYTVT